MMSNAIIASEIFVRYTKDNAPIIGTKVIKISSPAYPTDEIESLANTGSPHNTLYFSP